MPTTSNFGWTTPADTDLVKDGALAIRTLGNGIDTSFLDLKGGTTDQVLAKNSNTDLDFKWVTQDDSNAIQNAIVDAKGDLISATAADTPARLAVGANGTVLTADSTEATGLKWAAPASSSGPAFRAYRGTTDQNISRQTTTKVQFNAETFDTASCFDSTTNYRFTPNVAGYYQYNWRVNIGGLTGTQYSELQKNGTRTGRGSLSPQDGVYNYSVSCGSEILYMNGTTDYVEIYVYVEQASGTVFINEDAEGADTAFSGVWIRS